MLVTLLLSAAQAAPDLEQPLRTGANAPADTAVVVGIEDYAFVPDVPYATRDAKAFYDTLVYTIGVPASRVRLLDRGAGREQILEALEAAGREVGAGGTVWVYFAGHGAADPSTGERLLLGDDVRQDPTGFASRGVRVEEAKALASSGGGNVVLMVDACYGGLGRDGDELVPGKRFLVPAYARPTNPSIVEWNAAAGDQLSGPIHAVRHGAFTYFAVGALRGWADGHLTGVRDGKVTAEEAHLYVADALRTVQIHDQVPQLAVVNAGERVLSSGDALEPSPELSPGMFDGRRPQAGTNAPVGPLDPGDRPVVQAHVQSVVDRCVAEHGKADPRLGSWQVRFKVDPKGRVKGIWTVPATYVDDDTAHLTAQCMRQEIKASPWETPSKAVKFTALVKVSDTVPVAPEVVGGTVLIFRSADGEWVDVRVDGELVAQLRSSQAEERVRVREGVHHVSFTGFMEEAPYAQGQLTAGEDEEIVFGVQRRSRVEVYGHDGWSPSP